MVEKKTTKTTEEELPTVVVSELPTQGMRIVTGDDGKQYNLLTIQEACTEILERIKKIEKSVA